MNTPTVLIVEDSKLVAKFYRLALERAGGFRCLVTEDVEEILRHVESGRVDVAVLDISLNHSAWNGRGPCPSCWPPRTSCPATASASWPLPAPTIIWKSPSTIPRNWSTACAGCCSWPADSSLKSFQESLKSFSTQRARRKHKEHGVLLLRALCVCPVFSVLKVLQKLRVQRMLSRLALKLFPAMICWM
jgi:Response regulator receiver domain